MGRYMAILIYDEAVAWLEAQDIMGTFLFCPAQDMMGIYDGDGNDESN